LADLLELAERRPLAPRLPDGPGLGRVGVLPAATGVAELAARVKEEVGVRGLLLAGPAPRTGRTVAVCAGGAGSLVRAGPGGADVYLVGEMRHHDALLAARLGLTVLCTLHSNNERIALPSLAARLGAALPWVPVRVSAVDRDPYLLV